MIFGNRTGKVIKGFGVVNDIKKNLYKKGMQCLTSLIFDGSWSKLILRKTN